jgi:hypothetical protein
VNNETWFFQTETLILQYFKNEVRLSRLQEMKKVFLQNLQMLNHEMVQFKRIPGLTAKYSPLGRTQNSLKYDYADLMEEYENQVSTISHLMLERHKKLVSIQHRIYEIKEFNTPLKLAMTRLSLEEKMLMERKYDCKNSNYQIASLLHCSEKRVRYMHRKIVIQIAEYLDKKECYKTYSFKKNLI